MCGCGQGFKPRGHSPTIGVTFVPLSNRSHCDPLHVDINTDRVVVGIDGSASSIAALKYAARIANALDAPLEAVTTWTYPPITGAELVMHWQPEEDAKQVLDSAITDAFGDSSPKGLTRTVLSGPAARTLIEVSKTSGMLVLGSRGRGGFAALLLGSVSAACAEHAHCPVLIVHSLRTSAEAATTHTLSHSQPA